MTRRTSEKADGRNSARQRPAGRSDVAIVTKKKQRGRPFAQGEDPRRNMKGRVYKPVVKRGPAEEMLDALMTPVPIVKNNRRRKVPMLRAILEKQLVASAQGDLDAIRATSALVRAVKQLDRGAPSNQDDPSEPAHDRAALQKIMEDYRTAVRQGQASQQPPKKKEGKKR